MLMYDKYFKAEYEELKVLIYTEIESLNPEYLINNQKTKIISRINLSLRSMDLILLKNIELIIKEWKQSNGNA